MKIQLLFCMTVAILCNQAGFADDSDDDPENGPQTHLAIADLQPKLDGKEVTVRFVVTEAYGISQRSVPGQAPMFGLRGKYENKSKHFDVWVQGELANVLDRLQMSYTQMNEIKKGTTILATGKIRAHVDEQEWYTLYVEKWKRFRIVPPPQVK